MDTEAVDGLFRLWHRVSVSDRLKVLDVIVASRVGARELSGPGLLDRLGYLLGGPEFTDKDLDTELIELVLQLANRATVASMEKKENLGVELTLEDIQHGLQSALDHRQARIGKTG